MSSFIGGYLGYDKVASKLVPLTPFYLWFYLIDLQQHENERFLVGGILRAFCGVYIAFNLIFDPRNKGSKSFTFHDKVFRSSKPIMTKQVSGARVRGCSSAPSVN